MKVLVIGASGATGKEILLQLTGIIGIDVYAMIRNEDYRPYLEEIGCKVRNGDLTNDFRHVLEGIDTIIFTAGAGKNGNYEEIDYMGVVKAVQFGKRMGIRRFILLSALYADRPHEAPTFLFRKLSAKQKAENFLIQSGLCYTIIRPSRLSHGEHTQRIQAGNRLQPLAFFAVSRKDVAHTLISSLFIKETMNKAIDIHFGNTIIEEALRNAGKSE